MHPDEAVRRHWRFEMVTGNPQQLLDKFENEEGWRVANIEVIGMAEPRAGQLSLSAAPVPVIAVTMFRPCMGADCGCMGLSTT